VNRPRAGDPAPESLLGIDGSAPPGESVGAIGRHGIVYGGGMILNRIAGFLLIPILLHTLSAREWGAYSLILLVGQFLLVAPTSLIDAMARLHFDHDTKEGQDGVLATTLGFFLIFAVLFALFAYPLAVVTAKLVFHGQYVRELFVANLGLPFEILLDIQLTYLRIRKRSGLFVATTLGRSLIQFGAAILFVIGFGMGVMGVVLGGVVALVAVAVPVGFVTGRGVGVRPVRQVAKEIVRLAAPMAPSGAAKTALDLMESYLVSLFAGLGLVGVLAVATKLADQLRILVTGPFAQIWEVSVFEAAQDERQSAAVNRALVYFFLLLTGAAVTVGLFAPEIVRIIAAKPFWAAATVVPILVLSQIVKLLNFHFEIGLIERKRTGYLPFVNGGAVVLAFGLYGGLVPTFGLVGAALANLATHVSRLIAAATFAARCSNYTRDFPWKALAYLLGLGAATYVAGAHAFADGTILGMLGKAAAVFAFLVLGFVGPIFPGEERRGMLRDIGRRLGRSRARAAG
jgi:O-antigen/teichoic acid export membrane protein